MTTKKEVSSNPTLVAFPRDQYQVTQKLRAAGLRAAGRVGTTRDKLDVFLSTLDTLRDHAIARYKKNLEADKARHLVAKAREAGHAASKTARATRNVAVAQAALDAATQTATSMAEATAKAKAERAKATAARKAVNKETS